MADYNWQTFADKMKQLGDKLPEAMRKGTSKATEILHAESKKILNEAIYSKPEDRAGSSFRREKGGGGYKTDKQGKRIKYTTKIGDREQAAATGAGMKTGKRGGAKKWRRTGNLRNRERMKVLSPAEGAVYNDAGYALPRHDLGLHVGHPEAIEGSSRKSERIAPWRKRAIANTQQQRLEAYHEALWAAHTRR